MSNKQKKLFFQKFLEIKGIYLRIFSMTICVYLKHSVVCWSNANALTFVLEETMLKLFFFFF